MKYNKEELVEALNNMNDEKLFKGGFYLENNRNLRLTEDDLCNLIPAKKMTRLKKTVIEPNSWVDDEYVIYQDKEGKEYLRVIMLECTKVTIESTDPERGMEGDVFGFEFKERGVVGYFPFDPDTDFDIYRVNEGLYGR